MHGGCIQSVFSLEADIYTKVRTLNSKTGQYVVRWELWKTIGCDVTPFVSTSFKAQGVSELLGEEYIKLSYLTLRSAVDIGRNAQVTNIRNKASQQVIYKEIELKGAPATWFNANGSAPVVDPFGYVLEYRALINRADEQGELAV